MDISTVPRWLVAASLALLSTSCGATVSAAPGPSGPAELSRHVLVIQETQDGQVSHIWRPLSEFAPSELPLLANNGRLDGPVVRASFNRDCEAEQNRCEEMCRASLKGRNWTHARAGSKNAICFEKCMPAYLDCCRLKEAAEARKLRVRFPGVDSAVDWLKEHRRELAVGTVVVIAGVTFVVIVAGSGGAALVLAPAVLLVSAEASSTHAMAPVAP
ncbi:hypothetical protein ACLESD_33000 [Pyxidicoccus sp. 3LFB2]